jgi:hypothetical protein
MAKQPESKPTRTSPQTQELRKKILSFMKKGKEYSSRQVVEGVGRTPGGKEGGPVVRQLQQLAEERVVKHASTEGTRGFNWTKL